MQAQGRHHGIRQQSAPRKTLQFLWSGDGDNHAGGLRTHGGNVRKISSSCLDAELMRRGPLETEVRTVNHHVGGDDETAIWSLHHRTVITGAHNRGIGGGKPWEYASEDGRLRHFAQGLVYRIFTHPLTVA